MYKLTANLDLEFRIFLKDTFGQDFVRSLILFFNNLFMKRSA